MVVSLLSGVSSGVLTTVLLQPLDVAKTSLINPAVGQRSMVALFRAIWRDEGASRLWRGLEPALLRITLGSGCYFTAQTALVSAIRQKHSQRHAAQRSCCPAIVQSPPAACRLLFTAC